MKTGDNLIYRKELQKEIYPETEYGSFFGCLDAPENMPAGCMIAFDCGGGNAYPYQGWTRRERDWYMEQGVRVFGPPKPTEKRGSPATGKAKPGAERIAKLRQERNQGATKMDNLNAAVARQIQALKDSAQQVPECADEYQNMAWGVFGLWMDLAGYEPMDENDEIAKMRDFCTDW